MWDIASIRALIHLGVGMHVLDLFSGIGGFSLGLERAGMRTVAFCEIEPTASDVLRRRWPDVINLGDIKRVTADRLAALGIRVDVIAGGFPCQDISVANVAGLGLEGPRSGLWRECARVIGEVRPAFAILENVANLLDRGLGDVLGDLATLGYDAEWHCIPAAYVGAPHRRDRVWIVAHSQRSRRERSESWQGILGSEIQALAEHGDDFARGWSALESCASDCGSRDGVSVAMDRRYLHCLGNAVVPQIPELIGRAIMKAAA
jgi:DNA (cytosine-5)-methyltransferase 1